MRKIIMSLLSILTFSNAANKYILHLEHDDKIYDFKKISEHHDFDIGKFAANKKIDKHHEFKTLKKKEEDPQEYAEYTCKLMLHKEDVILQVGPQLKVTIVDLPILPNLLSRNRI